MSGLWPEQYGHFYCETCDDFHGVDEPCVPCSVCKVVHGADQKCEERTMIEGDREAKLESLRAERANLEFAERHGQLSEKGQIRLGWVNSAITAIEKDLSKPNHLDAGAYARKLHGTNAVRNLALAYLELEMDNKALHKGLEAAEVENPLPRIFYQNSVRDLQLEVLKQENQDLVRSLQLLSLLAEQQLKDEFPGDSAMALAVKVVDIVKAALIGRKLDKPQGTVDICGHRFYVGTEWHVEDEIECNLPTGHKGEHRHYNSPRRSPSTGEEGS